MNPKLPVTFDVPCIPVRAKRAEGRKGGGRFMEHGERVFRAYLKRFFEERFCDWVPIKNIAVRVDITVRIPTDESSRWGRPHTHTPDKDNFEKLVLDCMNKVLISDDRIVSAGDTRKRWSAPDSSGYTITIGEDDG